MSITTMIRNLKDKVLRQDLEGTYAKYSFRNQYKAMITIGVLSIGFGILSLLTFVNIESQSIQYSANTRTKIFLPQGTNLMYIQIDGLRQNNLKYSKSINYDQLKGQTTGLNLSDCSPYDYNNGKPYYPAGAVANTYFQDIINIEGVNIDQNDIAWSKELDVIGETNYTAKQIEIPENWTPSTNEGTEPLNTVQGSGLPILNERFVNWIYLSMFSSFRKLWGVVTVDQSGYYPLEIESIYDLSGKSLYFTQESWLGFKNYGLAITLMVLGLLNIISAIFIKRIAIRNDMF